MAKGLPRSLSRGDKLRDQFVRVQRIELENLEVTITDPGAATAYGSAVVAALPAEANLLVATGVFIGTVTKGDISIGDVFNGDIAFGHIGTSDSSITTVEQSIVRKHPIGPASSGVATVNANASTTSTVPSCQIIDNTNGSLNINVNVLIDDSDISANSSVIISGVLFLVYAVLGDD